MLAFGESSKPFLNRTNAAQSKVRADSMRINMRELVRFFTSPHATTWFAYALSLRLPHNKKPCALKVHRLRWPQMPCRSDLTCWVSAGFYTRCNDIPCQWCHRPSSKLFTNAFIWRIDENACLTLVTKCGPLFVSKHFLVLSRGHAAPLSRLFERSARRTL